MKKIKTHLLLLAVLGIGAAWVNKPRALPPTYHLYSFLTKSSDGSRFYYGRDLTSIGYVKGFDYICISASYICTFQGSPPNSHTDGTGSYFFAWDVPTAGIDNSGFYYDF